ncbi:hypothetical protein J437_LFUL007230 [Ladona fulva]|uniref:C-type lectin domain-containing protein n=1 Tax=Ladona fulva TaxID=123851 RepID=A0A8K0K6C7_LADFU|nr:hypothetical protein J437_LFUL007230 [Ladona fulva]
MEVLPPQRSEGYEFFPGIGYYKLHTASENFVNASNICRNEGAHLAIINSEEEATVLTKMLQKGEYDIVWVGFHDPRKNRDFRTIFGTPLNETGFSKWKKGQPDGASKQFCGYFDPEGLGDVECEATFPSVMNFKPLPTLSLLGTNYLAFILSMM